ncbi:MAG: phosphoheptose isomerase [Crocinitomicaceae bacterium]|nr:phosphoheptose isomerase [Crocinitomicaceae bacterium]
MKNNKEGFKLIDAEEDGKAISPVLPNEVKNYMIDIDGTICDDIPNEEPERMATAELFDDALETINTWFEEGHIITFFTSRVEEHREVTEQWLKENGFSYHGLLMGKPRGGNYHWIDNHIVRATRYTGKFTNLVEKSANIQIFKE